MILLQTKGKLSHSLRSIPSRYGLFASSLSFTFKHLYIYTTTNPFMVHSTTILKTLFDFSVFGVYILVQVKKEKTRKMVGLEELVAQPDPVALELNRLQNQLKEKERELGDAHSEIKGLRAADVFKEKAVEELANELNKLDEKLRLYQALLEQKNLDIKKLTNDKKEALAAQYAAEATVRRVHANQKDDDSFPIESVIAPLEADIRMYRQEVMTLQEEKRVLERLTKSKEAALLEVEKILKSALERTLVVEEIQNQNYELKRQIEICQEENKILEKTNRQKVIEVKKLGETIQELEEAILVGGAAANTIRDYRRRISELNEENRTLERELARIKVSANRVASAVANEWKDENDKVMPVKQWLEERRVMQAEMQRLKDKLAISERRANTEAQLKDKLKLRLKTLEEGLKSTNTSVDHKASSGTPKPGNSSSTENISTGERMRSVSQPRGSSVRPSPKPVLEKDLKRGNSLKMRYGFGELLVRKGLWSSRSKVGNIDDLERAKMGRENNDMNIDKIKENGSEVLDNVEPYVCVKEDPESITGLNPYKDDIVSGFLYDKLQKEVICLRKSCEKKDDNLNAKNEEIKVLMKKVDTLVRALEVESRKTKREAAAREKNSAANMIDGNKDLRKTKRIVK
ncbi:microtubule-associated protein 70-5-like [Apium graveolens]|uniref:microtubule-associated protein 70-5-like n=1 Tax=Apium graveolens TaxID=4045 RepID=UPI003D7B852B